MAKEKTQDEFHKKKISARQILIVFLKLGLTSFGGPVAHLGYFRDEIVSRRKWLSEAVYADLIALCQFLPGPASSQVGIGIGLVKGGYPGALAAWTGFTLPSALILILFGLGITMLGDEVTSTWLHGLKVVAVAIVVQAIWGMARVLCPDPQRISIAVAATLIMLIWPSPLAQVTVIFAGGLIGLFLSQTIDCEKTASLGISITHGWAITSLTVFIILLLGLPLIASQTPNQTLAIIDSFFRSGSLVFGGGHVVLPLLQGEVVPPGWVNSDAFMAGYGAAQAVPGPLFTFAAYLGTVSEATPNGWVGGLICLFAVFAPSFLLVMGVLPFWDTLRQINIIRRALVGINASVVGLLLAALYDPVWTNAIFKPSDFGLALLAFTLLVFWKVPSWLVVLLSSLGGAILTFI